MENKINAIETVFSQLNQEISRFKMDSTLHCTPGCGQCCFKSDIEATILEFLPFAFHLHKAQNAVAWLEQLKTSQSTVCLILRPGRKAAGLCSDYEHRSLVCRLFGFSARTDKYGKQQIISCVNIKGHDSAVYALAEKNVGLGGTIPVMMDYHMRLHAIDGELSQTFFPINEAIRRAIEVVMHHFAYR